MTQPVKIGGFSIGSGLPFALIAGPCVIENHETPYEIAARLKQLTERLDIPYIFKASYDKANRTSIHSFRGPGITEGLEVLSRIRQELGVPVLSDIHQLTDVAPAGRVLDVIQIPAFLCRQTDLLVEAAKTGKPLNIKKGQFLSPWDMTNVVEKIRHAGNNQILITERGAMFGYNNLVSDFRSIPIMQKTGCPVVFDATHSVQLPGGAGTASGGQREFAPLLAKAAIAVGADALFIEVHPDPDQALSDGPNAIKLDDVEKLLIRLKNIQQAVN
ncbi:MAG: 3-deoxy-8-phosphooctulonate synthase [Desulfobacterales bacterium]|nr:3-deoxy-8-phosphooctulonate synthase [Desulfobacterales bacterium]